MIKERDFIGGSERSGEKGYTQHCPKGTGVTEKRDEISESILII